MANSTLNQLTKSSQDDGVIPEENYMPKSFQPAHNDVLIGRGAAIVRHNSYLRRIVDSMLGAYSDAGKAEKSLIITKVTEHICANSVNGGFLKMDTNRGQWYKVEEYLMREKISQAFRDALGSYRSSNSCKKQRRKQARACAMTSTVKSSTQNVEMPALTPTYSSSASSSGSSSYDSVEPETSWLDSFAVLPTIAADSNPLEPNPIFDTSLAALDNLLEKRASTKELGADPFEPLNFSAEKGFTFSPDYFFGDEQGQARRSSMAVISAIMSARCA